MNIFPLRASHWLLAASLLLTAPALWSCNSQTTLQKQVQEHQDQINRIDEDTIQSYLRRHDLVNKSTRTNSGLYVVSQNDGNGPLATLGRSVRIKYVGRFLSNGAHPASTGYPASGGNGFFPAGAIFDNSADNHSSCGCAVFTAGSGAVAGFNEGLLLMRKGDRKLLLLPSRLAYGAGGSRDPYTQQTVVPADAALLFDVEVLDVL